MRIGLISEPKPYTRKILIRRLFGIGSTEKIENSSNPFETTVAIVPYPIKNLEKMSPEILNKKIKKIKSRLNLSGADRIVFSKEIKRICMDKGIISNEKTETGKKNLFLKLVPMCVRDTAKKCGIDLMKSFVCIRDTKMDRISEYLMRELCFDTKNLVIATQNKRRADKVCEKFYDETGLLINVTDLHCSKGDVVIDVDLCEVKIGKDLYVKEAEFGFDFGEYDVSQTEAAVGINTIDFGKIKWVYSYDC